MPVHINLDLGTFGRAAVARVSRGISLLAMQQHVRLCHFIDVCSRTLYAVRQARIGIHTNVRLRAEVLLIAFLGLMDLWISFALSILVELGAEIRVESTAVPDFSKKPL